ncbi:GNAT family N-acetyltransferase [Pseudoalteromonas denitrificans]|jgi:RimJ/RimL family protein N-acetyltransferase|uniref:Protein N-acetyltransferase, RimJ/RimL family n=1 Tax=Pseudoalteromonas denitrificans DSM 6059 TaxID=1123010 RepID=A0A1I1SS79_9GAMM|nr:GNAT family N-acetyltransferase [Pseudoalteromonas denitrificans]SFD49172.1 Protein N-acetyltransferase, RimJ/RimL family [Pseudoalteromonas denitrificans DSM 6059]
MHINNSERLQFELMTEKDVHLFFELDQNPEVMRFINNGKMTSMEDVINIYIPRMKSYVNEQKGWGQWKVTITNTQEFIGWVLVRPVDFFSDDPEFDNLELGWRFKQSAWGKGYATEAAKSIMDAVSNNNDINKISAIALEGNLGSINIMTKLGMKYIKTYIHKDPLGDVEAVYFEKVLPE